MFTTPAMAQASGDPMAGNGSFFIMMILLFGLFYFLIIRPQRKYEKQRQEKLQGIRRGDRVLTAGGIIGKVSKAPTTDEDEIEVEIAKGVNVKVSRATIARVMSKNEPVSDTDKA